VAALLSLAPWAAQAATSGLPPTPRTDIPASSAAPGVPASPAAADAPPTALQAIGHKLAAPSRLSESWLTVLGSTPDLEATHYPAGLMWLAPAARAEQRRELRALLQTLQQRGRQRPDRAAATDSVRQALAALPITGRVPLPAQDPHWLMANPSQDPVLAAGDEWWLPPRPTRVRVWMGDGRRCDVALNDERAVATVIEACAAGTGGPVDEAWVVQPDGRVQRVGLAPWRPTAPVIPAPGAWIWAPARGDEWPAELSDRLAAWLATQGPAGTEPAPSAERLATVPESGSPLPAGALRPLAIRASDWGITGLLQTPTARTRPAGALGLVISRTWPYTQTSIVLSPFDRVELAVRYTTISNQLYGSSIAGEQSYKDKSAELKWRLLDEGIWTPAVAVGLRDPGGTGAFGGEYVVASKRWGDWDLSVGLGWGYLGARGDVGNPLARAGLRSAQRGSSNTSSGGTTNLSALFSGPAALFGGVQWQTPWDDVVLRLEWDGNDYATESIAGPLPARTGLNAGVSWRWAGAEVGLAYQRGNRWSLSLAWLGSLPAAHMPKTAVPRPPVVGEAAPAAAVSALASATGGLPAPDGATAVTAATTAPSVEAPVPVLSLQSPAAPEVALARTHPDALRQHALLVELAQHTGWHATAIERSPGRWTARFDQASGAHVQERIERVWAVLHREAPPDVTLLALELASRQLPLVRHEVDRQAWAASRARHLARHQRPAEGPGDGTRPPQEPARPDWLTAAPEDTPRLATGVNLSYQQHLGGPDGYLYALSARGFLQWRAWSGAWLQGSVSLRLLDNYHRFRYTAPSNLPRVRTLQREYVTTSRLTVPNLQFTQAARLAPGVYGMLYGGWLEPMFAGVGAELLWRPLGSPWAVGLDLNRVRQREVDQGFGLQDYAVTTGHLTVRWDTGWQDVVAGASVGQYLAGDRGVTVDLARVFPNGTRMGVWATKTNVSAEQFGEGSFDKGLYVSVPFDAMFTSWSGSAMTVAWQPLIRDGGAKLQRGASLWGLTELRDSRLMTWRSASGD
jgi:hypothetical protein